MSTAMLYREDAYARGCVTRVLAAGPEGVLLDRTVFYPQGGGQPGDQGSLRFEDGREIRVGTRSTGRTARRSCTSSRVIRPRLGIRSR